MNEHDLDAIEQRAVAATPGPWRWGDWSATFGTFEDPDHRNRLEQAMDRPVDDIVIRRRDEPPTEGVLEVEDALDCKPSDLDFIAASRTDVPALIAALRAAWAERDEFRASFPELFETTRRYREALVEIRDRRPVWGILEGPYDGAETWVDAISRLCKVAAVALATPGAGDPATTEERGSSS